MRPPTVADGPTAPEGGGDAAAADPPRAGRALSDVTRFTWLCGTVVALPILVTAAKAGLDGWVPHSDMAVVALRAGDVPTRGTPLLGMPSSIVEQVPGAEVFHPGPTLFWALAPFVAAFGPAWGSLLGVAAVRLASVVALGALAARTGRRGVVATVMATALVTLATVEDWGGGYSSLNPITVALPFLVVLVAAWRLADGDPWALPILAASSTFTVQGHLSYLPVTTVVALWAASAGWLDARRRTAAGDRQRWRGPIVGAAAVLAVMWSLPLYDALTDAGGNLAQMAKVPGGGVPSRGWTGGRDALGALLRGVVGGKQRPARRVEQGVTAGTLLGCAAVATGLLRTRRRSDRVAQRLLQTGLVASLGCALGVARLPAEPLEDLQLLWIPVTAALLVAGVILAFTPDRPIAPERPIVAPAAALAILVLLAVGPAWPGDIRDPHLYDWAVIDAVPAVTQQVTDATAPGLYAVRAGNGVRPTLVMSGLVVALEDQGYRVRVGRGDANAFGGARLVGVNGSPPTELIVLNAAVPPPRDAEVIARFEEDRGDPLARAAALDRLAEVMRAAPTLELTSEGRRRVMADLTEGFGLSPEEAEAATTDPGRLVDVSPTLVADSFRDGFILAPTLPVDLSTQLIAQVPLSIVVVERPLR